MVMRNRSGRPRIPRKEKVWASFLLSDALGAATHGVAGVLLDQWKSAMGVNFMQAVTLMRIVGYIRLFEGGEATTAVNAKVRWGIAWLESSIASGADGDGNIPKPGEAIREAEWIQRGVLLGQEYTAAQPTGSTLLPIDTAFQRVDITQQRKQPTIGHELCLVWHNLSSTEANTVSLEFEGHAMLALP